MQLSQLAFLYKKCEINSRVKFDKKIRMKVKFLAWFLAQHLGTN
jgi:hypothetical protein